MMDTFSCGHVSLEYNDGIGLNIISLRWMLSGVSLTLDGSQRCDYVRYIRGSVV